MATTSTERVRAMRERRRQAAEEADTAEVALRPADQLLSPAIEQTLTALDLDGADTAAAQLVRQYARTIDRAKDQAYAMRWLGPLLLDGLTALNATPMARTKAKTASTGKRQPNALDQLRMVRRQGPI
jgi:hypothetical protein